MILYNEAVERRRRRGGGHEALPLVLSTSTDTEEPFQSHQNFSILFPGIGLNEIIIFCLGGKRIEVLGG